MSTQERIETFEVSSKYNGERADIILSDYLDKLSRSQVKKLIDEELVLVDGNPVKPSKRLEGGEKVSVTIPEPEPIEALPEDLPVSIVYEDEDIIVVDKPAGMVVHPGAGNRNGTLVNALLYKCELSSIGGRIRPGIVHRLDKETSGIIVVAKNDLSHRSLVDQFKSREVTKTYIALVAGSIDRERGTFTSSIGRHPVSRVKMSTKAKNGKKAFTSWRVLKRLPEATFVEARPKTGRTHQIRVHFSENGYPILGDKLYGQKNSSSDLMKSVSKKLGRQALHALSISFVHPRSGERVEYSAPIPEDIEEAVRLLEDITEAEIGVA